jgi:hypothetical protein
VRKIDDFDIGILPGFFAAGGFCAAGRAWRSSSKQETQARNRTLSDASFRCAFSSASSEIRGKTNEITIWIA